MSRKPVERLVLHCEVCDAPILIKPSELRKRRVVRYCSTICMGVAFRADPETHVTITCAHCGKSFTVTRGRSEGRKYCSYACSGASKSPTPEHPKWRDPGQIKAYLHDYSQRNREAALARNRDWSQRNPKLKAEMQKKYRDSHKAEIRAASRSRRVAYSTRVTEQEWLDLKAKYDNRCLCCGNQEPAVKLEMDHVIPLAKGGRHSLDNLQPLCRSCNAHKLTKVVDYRRPSEVKGKADVAYLIRARLFLFQHPDVDFRVVRA